MCIEEGSMDILQTNLNERLNYVSWLPRALFLKIKSVCACGEDEIYAKNGIRLVLLKKEENKKTERKKEERVQKYGMHQFIKRNLQQGTDICR